MVYFQLEKISQIFMRNQLKCKTKMQKQKMVIGIFIICFINTFLVSNFIILCQIEPKGKMSLKKTKNNQEEQIKAIVQEQKRQKAAAEEHKNKMRPFVNFLKKKQLKFNHARVGDSRIEYFRIDQFQKILSENYQQIQQHEDFNSIAKQVRQELIYFKRPSHLKGKYPDMLQPIPSDHNEKKYACFRFDTTESKRWLMWTIIFTVLSLVLFPVWPYELKYGIWLVSFILLIVLVSLIVLRLLIYVVCVIFGFNVWIFPNLLGEQGFVQSFKPFVYYQKWQTNLYNTLIRVFVVSSLIAYGCYLYLNPHIFYENIQFTKQTVQDLHDWGVHKIKNEKNFSQRAITNLDVILNETADVIQSENADYAYFNQNAQNQT